MEAVFDRLANYLFRGLLTGTQAWADKSIVSSACCFVKGRAAGLRPWPA
ncbi:MAG: hypothetical protein ACTFAK_03585 [Candidatus Electronema sp. VV]